MLLHDLILDRIDSHGDQLALIRGDESISYAELGQRIFNVAAGFRASGVCKGDRIAVYLNKRSEGVVAYFAASLCGAVFVPVNPAQFLI